MNYGITILYCVDIFSCTLYFHFSKYPRKLNDNEKLWIYSISIYSGLHLENLPRGGGAKIGDAFSNFNAQ